MGGSQVGGHEWGVIGGETWLGGHEQGDTGRGTWVGDMGQADMGGGTWVGEHGRGKWVGEAMGTSGLPLPVPHYHQVLALEVLRSVRRDTYGRTRHQQQRDGHPDGIAGTAHFRVAT